MKRTPLNRGTSQLKRTPMKKRRTRHKDTAESLSIRVQYRADNQECEVSAFLVRVTKAASKRNGEYHAIWQWRDSYGAVWHKERPVEIDHIWGGTAGRLDVQSMLIAVSPEWHEWKTARPTLGRLLFLIVKANKATPETSNDEFCRCSGRDSLSGWLAMDDTINACPAWLNPYRLRLIASLPDPKR